MQLDVFWAEETVRDFERRVAAHVERERNAELFASAQCRRNDRQPAVIPAQQRSRMRTAFRWHLHVCCRAIPRRWNPCLALS